MLFLGNFALPMFCRLEHTSVYCMKFKKLQMKVNFKHYLKVIQF